MDLYDEWLCQWFGFITFHTRYIITPRSYISIMIDVISHISMVFPERPIEIPWQGYAIISHSFIWDVITFPFPKLCVGLANLCYCLSYTIYDSKNIIYHFYDWCYRRQFHGFHGAAGADGHCFRQLFPGCRTYRLDNIQYVIVFLL